MTTTAPNNRAPLRTTTAVALLLVAVSTMAVCATALSLPSAVVSGYTVCANLPECDVGGSGTTLQVATMTDTANSGGNSTAIFKTQGTTFTGKLTVDCLTGSPWASGVNLVVEIRDGASAVGGALPTTIDIKGQLSLGSSVTIINGTYDFTSVFIVLTSFGVNDGSALVITGLVFDHTTLPISVLQTSEALELSTNSKIEISYNRHTFSSFTGGSTWTWNMFSADSSLTLSTGSAVTVVGNSLTLSSITAPVCNIGVVSILHLALTMSDSSSLVISNNAFNAKSLTASSGGLAVTMLSQSPSIQLASGASVRITGNTVDMLSVTATAVLTLAILDALALVTDNATVTVSDNGFDLSIVTANSMIAAYLRPTSMSSTNLAHTEVSSNWFTRSELTITDPSLTSIAFVGGATTGGVNVHGGSTLAINRNTVTDGDKPSSAFANVRFMVAGGVTQDGGGVISVSHNAVVFATTLPTLFTLTTNNASIAVCMNTVNHLPCRTGATYSCAQTEAANVVFTSCTATVTPTLTVARTPTGGYPSTTTALTTSTTTSGSSGNTSSTTTTTSGNTTTTAAPGSDGAAHMTGSLLVSTITLLVMVVAAIVV